MPENPKPRRRGAQPHNTNALKHGFYSSRFHKTDLRSLQNHEFVGLSEEIALMRLILRRAAEVAAQTTTLPDTLDILRAVSFAASSLARLVRTQYFISSQNDDVNAALQQALTQVMAEFGIGADDPSPDDDSRYTPLLAAEEAP